MHFPIYTMHFSDSVYIEFPVELFPVIFSNNDVITLHQHYIIVKLFIDCEYVQDD